MPGGLESAASAAAASAAAASAAAASAAAASTRRLGRRGLDRAAPRRRARRRPAPSTAAGPPSPGRRDGPGGARRHGREPQLRPRARRGAADVALVDPHLHADAAERRAGLVEAVVDVRAQRVQRDATLAVELRAAHLGAAEAARALHPDALGAGLHRRLHRLAHGATERDAAGQLLGDALRDELGVDLGVLHLEDVELDLLAGQLLEVAADAVGLGAAAADDDAGTGGVDVDADPVTGALDLDAGDAGPLHALGHAAGGSPRLP